MTQSLNTMLLADLKSLASGLGIKGTSSMKKAQLVEAIQAHGNPQQQRKQQQRKQDQPQKDQGKQSQPQQDQSKQSQPKQDQGKQSQPKQDQGKQDQGKQDQGKQDQGKQDQPKQDEGDDDGSGRRSRRRRNRERNRQTGGQPARFEADAQVLDDDILVPAAGILDVLDNYAFVRTSGYLPGPDDVYLSLSLVRRYGLRRGDAVVGQVRHPREGERKEKFNPMVRIDSVNGADPEVARTRADFATLTPVHPTEQLRLEQSGEEHLGRVLDLVAPLGKGQRGLVVAPYDAGKTTLLQSVARAITARNPECHLMVVLVDERPEEVTDYQRAVKGEVIASTFDRAPADHTTVAELAIERAKRLVELNHDVVVLLDGLTRLGRAYQHAAPTGSRGSGADTSALYSPKRFFGAARNIENGGSLTILATAAVDSGSQLDELILEELQGTANAEIRLRRELLEAGLRPPVDVTESGTRHEELLRPEAELAVVTSLRESWAGLEPAAALESLLGRLTRTGSNAELLLARDWAE